MKKNIHPNYYQIKAICSCGNIIIINSTLNHEITLDVCGLCHPFYTGKYRLIDRGSRINRFNKKLNMKIFN